MTRKYREEEIPELLVIWEKAANLAHPFLDDSFHSMVKNMMREKYLPDSDTWVYEESGKIIGFISMIENEIGGLFVHPDSHSKGIGTSLVTYISQFHKVLEVEVFINNKIGVPFYQKNNFTVFNEYLMKETNETVLRMRKF